MSHDTTEHWGAGAWAPPELGPGWIRLSKLRVDSGAACSKSLAESPVVGNARGAERFDRLCQVSTVQVVSIEHKAQ